MSINFLPLSNAIDLVTSAVTDSITGSAITDAILTAVLKTEGGVTLATSSALTHSGGGIYKGTFDISAVGLTLNTHYYLSVGASNYALQWKHLYRAEDRPFTGTSSAAVDTTPGTSGLTSVTGVPLGDGTGAYTGLSTSGTGSVVRTTAPTLQAAISFGSTTVASGVGNASLTISAPAAATAGFPAYTQGLFLKGNAYDTGASASRGTDWEIFNLPADANPAVASLKLAYQYNAGGYATKFAFGSDGTLKDGSGVSLIPRHMTLVIAASDSVKITGADYVCSGTADQTTINDAIAALPAGGTLLFRDGHYVCTAAWTTITTPNIHLKGESHPYFAAWGGGYPNYDTPGNPGGAQIRFLGNINGIGMSVSGVMIESLYVVNLNAGQSAYGYNGTGIFSTGDHCMLIDCFVQGWATGVDWLSDSSDISLCNIGNCFSYAIKLTYGSINVSQNVIYANHGYGIYSLLGVDAGARIMNNQIGVSGVAAISIGQKRTIVQGNVIAAFQNASDSAIEIRSGASGCVITGNTIQISSNFDGSSAVANTSGDGVKVGSDGAASNCVISDNYIDNAGGTNSSGYAIAFRNSSTKCTAIGNVIPVGKFNSAGSTTILWGTGNIGATLNAGDA